MRSLVTAIALALLLVVSARAAQARDVIVGANVYDENVISPAEQEAEIERLAAAGVTTIRTGLSSKSISFIIRAYGHGIGTDAVVYPTEGSHAKTTRTWSDAPLSDADPSGFAAWLEPLLRQLETAGVRLTVMELGNEINSSRFDGDIPLPGTGRVLGLAELDDPHDAEGPAIARGFRTYLRVMAVLRDVRDRSTLNRTTPIILGGLAEWGLPGPRAWDGDTGVSMPDTIEYLRHNGLDGLVDGYGVHVYPTGDPKAGVSARVAELDAKKIFTKCRADKPCWLTEWGIGNAGPCPLDDAKRAIAVTAERAALDTYASQGRLAAAIWYDWTGLPGPKEDAAAIYRCGALTDSGREALRAFAPGSS